MPSSAPALTSLLSPPLVVLALAVALDAVLGDPPNRLHPVAWIGRLIAGGRRVLCVGSPLRLLIGGAATALAAASLALLVGMLVASLARRSGAVGAVVEALALSMMLSLRGLVAAAREVRAALGAGDLAGARSSVGRHLVSRPTATLGAGQVAAATIESVAENLTDGFVAPVLFYLVGGLPGAFVYRAINTADSMIGYRDGALEHFGKVAARLDDALNFLPARMTGFGLVAAAGLVGLDGPRAWRTMLRDRRRTASPNAGWTMSAMAGALGVRLEKPGLYVLGDGPEPGVDDITIAVRIMLVAALLVCGVLSLCINLLQWAA